MKQFDKHADAYHRIRDRIRYPESVYSTIASRTKSQESVLDIGCGNGVSTVRLRPHFDYVEGCDLSPNLIAKAQSTHSELVFSVSPAETYQSARRFDAVTSATSFYWMDREKVLVKLRQLLKPGGIFCAYKYDFPIVYGPLRDFIEKELVTKWCKFRDERLTKYDDSLELIAACGWMSSAERLVFPNIIDLSPREVGLFFLSSSYVTRYVESQNGDYAEEFLRRIAEIEPSDNVKVNFDIHAFFAQYGGE